jgi:hemerythrin superfamily protein
MDIYDYLKADHEKVAHLFKQFEKTKEYELKSAIVAMIIQELYVHAESEQATFYKALEQFQTSREIALHGEKEHHEIEVLMDDIISHMEDTRAWNKKVIKLKKLVQHHVKEEEGKMFRKAKKVLLQPQPFVLKEQMHYLKSTLKNKLAKAELA